MTPIEALKLALEREEALLSFSIDLTKICDKINLSHD
jgi:hypothetical protein